MRLYPRYLLTFIFLLSAGTTVAAPDIAEKPANMQTVDTSYRIHAGDLLRVTVWKEDNMDQDVLVLPDGSFVFPLIGTVTVAGLTAADLQDVVKGKLARFIPNASVTVVVKETRGNSVSVMGQVARPGEIVMNRKMTVMQALSQVGGLTNYADNSSIVIIRKSHGKDISIPFDYSAIAAGRELESNIALEPGDVIVVPTASLF